MNKTIIIFFLVTTSLGLSAAEAGTKASCIVSSRGQQIGNEMLAFAGLPGSLRFFEIVQNDGSTTKYRVVVSAYDTLRISILDNRKSVDMGTWSGVETIAEGVTSLAIGAKLTVSTGSEAKTLKALLQLDCKVIE